MIRPASAPFAARTLATCAFVTVGLVASTLMGIAPPPATAAPSAVVTAADPTAGVPAAPAPPAATSQLIPCSSAATRHVVTVSSHLDPTCTYTGGFDVTASDVVLDCQGALIQGVDGTGDRGIEISTPYTVDQSGDVVRNCRTEGFLNSLRVTRVGFRAITEGHGFDHTLSDVVVEHSEFSDSRGVGVYVDGYVSAVTLRRLVITGAGSTGIYLEAGSKDNDVEHNVVRDNGFRENGLAGSLATLLGMQFRYWGTGREGLAIDGSRDNRVTGNSFEGNSAGGIFLYTNCGEYKTTKPDRWFPRYPGANGNLIEGNSFTGGVHGVWVGQRMGENTYPMDCSNPAYVTSPLVSITLDYASGNTVENNEFHDVTYGVRVEDDGTRVIGNTFSGPSGAYHAVIVGTRVRTSALAHPVTHTTVTGNVSTIVANPNPYRWVHGISDITVTGNTALGRTVGICPGQELPHLFLISVLAVAAEPVGSPVTPTPPGLTMPTLGAIPPCAPSVIPTIVPTGVSTIEGDTGTRSMEVPVTLTSASDQTVTATWSTAFVPGTSTGQAEPGIDYVPASGTVVFGPGETLKTVSVTVIGDAVDEPDEFVVVSFRNPTNAKPGGFWGIGFGLIVDDD